MFFGFSISGFGIKPFVLDVGGVRSSRLVLWVSCCLGFGSRISWLEYLPPLTDNTLPKMVPK